MRILFQVFRSPSFWIAILVAGVVDGLVYLANPTALRDYSISTAVGVITFFVVGTYRTFVH